MHLRKLGNHACWLLSKHASFSLRPHCTNARRDRCQEYRYHNCFPFGELEETTRTSSNYMDDDYPARPEIKQSLPGWGDNCGSESSTLETDVCVWRYAPLVVLATQEEEDLRKIKPKWHRRWTHFTLHSKPSEHSSCWQTTDHQNSTLPTFLQAGPLDSA